VVERGCPATRCRSQSTGVTDCYRIVTISTVTRKYPRPRKRDTCHEAGDYTERMTKDRIRGGKQRRIRNARGKE
jgi:hypothetical protein